MGFEQILRPCQISAMLEHALGIVWERKKAEAQGSDPNQTFCITSFCNTLLFQGLLDSWIYMVLLLSDKWITSHGSRKYLLCSWWVWRDLCFWADWNFPKCNWDFYLQLYPQLDICFPSKYTKYAKGFWKLASADHKVVGHLVKNILHC